MEEKMPPVFDSDRLKLWQGRELNENFKKTIETIKKFGWQTWSVSASDTSPSFSYTVGVHDLLGLPELIAVGLLDETGGSSLNRAVKLMREGVDLTKGTFRDIVGEVEVEFLTVDPKWLHHVMLRTHWYYEGADVPVLQLVYPDLENRFQWEDGFTDYFRQPILAPGYPEQHLEHDFWASHDRNSCLFQWKFPDPPHTRVFLSGAVQAKTEAVTYVSHDEEDGAWQFLDDGMADSGGPVISCFHHPIDADRTLEELADLPLGWYAVRATPDAPWERFEHGPEEQEE